MPSMTERARIDHLFGQLMRWGIWRQRHGLLARLALSIGLTALALLVRHLISDWTGGGFPFLALAPAAVVVTLLAGLPAGLVSTLLGVSMAAWLFAPPPPQAGATGLAGLYFWPYLSYLVLQSMLCTIMALAQRQHAQHTAIQQTLAATEEAQQSLNRLFRATFEHAAVGLSHVSLNGRLLRTNAKMAEIVGYTPQELMQLTFQDITHPDDLQEDLDLLHQALNAPRSPHPGPSDSYQIEKRYIHKQGHIVWASLTVALMRTPEGDPDYFISVVQDISQRKQTEEQLQRQEQQLSIIARHIPGGLARLDLDLRYRYVSDAFSRFYRRPIPDIIGLGFEELLGPAAASAARSHAEQALAGRVSTYENCLHSPTGQEIWVEVTSVPERAEDGSVSGVINVITFITERKRAQLALLESQHLLLHAQTIAHLASWTFDLQTRVYHLHEGGQRVFGLPEKSVTADEISSVIHPADRDAMRVTWRDALLHKPDYAFEFRIVHEGKIRWLYSRAEIIRDESGLAIRAFGITQDITEQKEASEALQDKERLLVHAQNMAQVVSWTFDPATQMYHSPSSTPGFLGRQENSLSMADFVQMVHPDDLPAAMQLWHATLRGEGAYNAEYRVQVGQKVRWHHTRAECVRDRDGKLLRVLGVTQDVTNRKSAEQEILQLNTQLEQRIVERTNELREANSELESFAYAVAHDLRAPLRSMNGFSLALLDEPVIRQDAALSSSLDHIVEASKKMGALIDGLLQMSRHARSELSRTDVNLSALAERLLQELARAEPGRQVGWQIEPDMVVHADPHLLEALLGNLLSNAWKYTARTPGAHIGFSSTLENGERAYTIRDNGAGFSMHHAGKLFQPFQRLHRQDDFPGIGIGLATALRIVRRHGGELRAIGAPGEGASFSFTLPGSAPQSTRGDHS